MSTKKHINTHINTHIHKYITNNNNLNIKNTKTQKQLSNGNNTKYILSEVKDETSYNHFKSLLQSSPNLCKGKTHSGSRYKVNIALNKDFATLKKNQHYRLIYIHNNNEIVAYISVKLYKKDGGFMFIHKVCSTGGGQGTRLMKMILKDAQKNYEKLNITYLSLTTHNLDLIDYYNTFNPTRTEIVDNPGTKALVPKKVAYMIWQLSPNMPELDYS
jgi:regulator of replication initiation timing